MRRIVSYLVALFVALFVLAQASDAGWPFGGKCRGGSCGVAAAPTYPVYRYQPVAYAAPVVPAVPAAQRQAEAVQAAGGGAAGFLAWLNATRAQYGLPAVVYDATVEASCHQNNLMQAARGMGHHFMGCHRRQNAAMGLGFPGIEAAWMGSPGHCSALLDPGITRVAIAWYGAYCTFGAN